MNAHLVKSRLLLAIAAATILWISCNNPFFPETGLNNASPLRTSPRGVLDLLEKAYETRRLQLFRDLFSSRKDFRYYVPRNNLQNLNKLSARSAVEVLDSGFVFIDSLNSYNYITYSDEISIHKNLFENVEELYLLLDISDVSVKDTFVRIDTVCRYDTTSADSSPIDMLCEEVLIHDTLSVEYKTSETSALYIKSDRIFSLFGSYVIGIGPQVFYVVRDPDNPALWVLDKWFELPDFL
ncbi:MAG: hypothetical protein GF398_17340 [Chitinivibrionales bacterium]|nr:hypothetical protein [Chitinivibrionales bacterium]